MNPREESIRATIACLEEVIGLESKIDRLGQQAYELLTLPLSTTEDYSAVGQMICLDGEVHDLNLQIAKMQNVQQSLLSDLYVKNYALVDQWFLIASASKVVKLKEWDGSNSPIVFEVLDIIIR